jgi:hypothetical protein
MESADQTQVQVGQTTNVLAGLLTVVNTLGERHENSLSETLSKCNPPAVWRGNRQQPLAQLPPIATIPLAFLRSTELSASARGINNEDFSDSQIQNLRTRVVIG